MSEPLIKNIPPEAMAVFLRQRDAGNPDWANNLSDFINGKIVEGAEEAMAYILLNGLRNLPDNPPAV